MKAKRNATRPEIIAIHGRLMELINKLDGGLCEYKNGYDDAKLAEEMKVPLTSVRSIRAEMFGSIRRASVVNAAEVEMLKGQIAQLLVHVVALTERHNKLVMSLHMNKVADVKHLVIENMKVPQS